MTILQHSRRRFFLNFFGVGLTVLLVRPCIVWTAVGKRTKLDPLSSRLKELLKHKESALSIGREYLRIVPNESNLKALLDFISSVCGQSVLDLDAQKLREYLRLRTRQDFEEGHVIRIHGWMLSITEARLCGLAALALTR
jgi:hypothetical protein